MMQNDIKEDFTQHGWYDLADKLLITSKMYGVDISTGKSIMRDSNQDGFKQSLINIVKIANDRTVNIPVPFWLYKKIQSAAALENQSPEKYILNILVNSHR